MIASSRERLQRRSQATLSVLDASLLDGDGRDRARFIENLRKACLDTGAFYLINPISASDCDHVLRSSRAFFALPREEKTKTDIKRSNHFRGYSEMTNERDWREQVHFGSEQSAVDRGSDTPDYCQLLGPNLWPAKLGDEWRATMLTYLDQATRLGLRLSSAAAEAAGLGRNYFDALAQNSPYMLMKLICYYPQMRSQSPRNGVAAHCDWSWLTVLLQSDSGLQVQARNGKWIDVPQIPGALVINLGELIEITTRGLFRATPHRVINNSWERPRVSIPVFINPNLDAMVEPISALCPDQNILEEPTESHIHRVVDPKAPVNPFIFGDSEWRRKGLGCWCYRDKCLGY